MKLPTFLLEERLREHYYDAEIVLCLSGVEDYSFGEIRRLASIPGDELDDIILLDSPREGDPDLRSAIARRWGDGDPEKVLVTHGSTEGMFLVMNALLEPGDEVIVPSPCYQPLASIPEAIGCKVRDWRLRPEDGFAPDVEQVKELITSRTRMLIANFPHNPTGVTLTPAQQRRLVEIAGDADAHLVWDAAFTDLCYDAAPLADPASLYPKSITLGTLSKSYGLGGLRIGWCVAGREVLAPCIRMRGYLTVNLSPLVERIALRVVENLDAVVADRLGKARENLAILSDWMERHREAVQWRRPQGGVTAFPSPAWVGDVDSFCERFATERGVLLLPGSCFGHPRHFRLGFGGKASELREGLLRLSAFLEEERRKPAVRSGSKAPDAAATDPRPTRPKSAAEVRIRRATVDDARRVAEVMNAVIAERRYTLFDQPFTEPEERDFIASMGSRSALFVAEIGEDVVGVQSLDIFADHAASVRHVATMGTWLRSDARGKGIGRRLAEASFRFAREHGYGKIVIQVLADNHRALRFYRGLGFEEIGIAKRHVKLAERLLDEVYLERQL